MSKRVPTYRFASYVFSEEEDENNDKDAIWLLSLDDKQMESFFNSCHNEWIVVIEKYLDRLVAWYRTVPQGAETIHLVNKLRELYTEAIKVEPDILSESLLEEITFDEFPVWASCVYLSIMSEEWNEVKNGKLILKFSGIYLLKGILKDIEDNGNNKD